MANYKIKDLPNEDRPREKLLKNGALFLHHLRGLIIFMILVNTDCRFIQT